MSPETLKVTGQICQVNKNTDILPEGSTGELAGELPGELRHDNNNVTLLSALPKLGTFLKNAMQLCIKFADSRKLFLIWTGEYVTMK